MGRKEKFYCPLFDTAYAINANSRVRMPITIIKVGKLSVSFVMSINTPKPTKNDTPDNVLITVVIRLVSKFIPIANINVTNENSNAEPVVA